MGKLLNIQPSLNKLNLSFNLITCFVLRMVTYQASSGSILSKALILILPLNIQLMLIQLLNEYYKYKY